jgi:hypothetical protein
MYYLEEIQSLKSQSKLSIGRILLLLLRLNSKAFMDVGSLGDPK